MTSQPTPGALNTAAQERDRSEARLPVPKTEDRRLRGTLHAKFRKFRDSLKEEFKDRDPRDLDRLLARTAGNVFRAGGPGRPNDDAVTRAYQMRAAGKSWAKIYRKCGAKTPGEQDALRSAERHRRLAKARKRRRRRRTPENHVK